MIDYIKKLIPTKKPMKKEPLCDDWTEKEEKNQWWLDRINKGEVDLIGDFEEEWDNGFYSFFKDHPLEAAKVMPWLDEIDIKVNTIDREIFYCLYHENLSPFLNKKKDEKTGKEIYTFSGEYVGGGFLEEGATIGIPILIKARQEKITAQDSDIDIDTNLLPFEILVEDKKVNQNYFVTASILKNDPHEIFCDDYHHDDTNIINNKDVYLWLIYNKNEFGDLSKPITIKMNNKIIWNDVIKPVYLSHIPENKREMTSEELDKYTLYCYSYSEDDPQADSIFDYISDKYNEESVGKYHGKQDEESSKYRYKSLHE